MSVPVNPKSIVPIPDGYQPFPFEKAGCSTQELLQEAYERYADRIALEADGRKISYRELDRLTNQLANYILERMGDKEEPVAILVEQGLSQVIAVLAVLKAGKIYSVLDLVNPPEMLANMLADFGARLIVSNSNNSALARSIADQSVSIIEMDALKGNDGKIFVRRSPENLMAVYYTSGSIGRPKGVVYTHHSLNHFLITVINLYCMNPHDKQPLPFSCSFSWSVSPLFPTLLCGGTLYPVDLRRMNMLAFAAFVEEKRITILQVSSSLLRSFMGVLENTWRHFPHLRILLTGSETIQAEDIRIWQSLFSERTVLGCAFAMSEATLLSVNFVRYDSDIPQETISLGLPLPGKEILIVDEERHSLPQGEVGEIAIRSKYLPYGYWNKPEMTDAVYHADPNDPSKRIYYSNDLGRLLPNGQLEHLGRKDNIVKIRAYRVDLTEIEQAIYDLHSVRQAVVVAIPARHDPAQKQLVAYLVVKPFVPCDPSAFRKGLEKNCQPI
ncbi:MAG: AMP-binding protein [Chloroflexi bacterium]|nr:AMP-binding protein [Chloroflexota bacterium]MBI3340053.1 AMP-binding protein [Chloroflexota bacterium]